MGVALKEKSGPVGAVIVKLVLDISKKILDEQRTITRQVVDGLLGTIISCEPSLATFVARVMGYVKPPSVESKISTLAQLTGAAAVPATSQVTV